MAALDGGMDRDNVAIITAAIQTGCAARIAELKSTEGFIKENPDCSLLELLRDEDNLTVLEAVKNFSLLWQLIDADCVFCLEDPDTMLQVLKKVDAAASNKLFGAVKPHVMDRWCLKESHGFLTFWKYFRGLCDRASWSRNKLMIRLKSH